MKTNGLDLVKSEVKQLTNYSYQSTFFRPVFGSTKQSKSTRIPVVLAPTKQQLMVRYRQYPMTPALQTVNNNALLSWSFLQYIIASTVVLERSPTNRLECKEIAFLQLKIPLVCTQPGAPD